jgi:hypothetical protein
VNSPPLPPYIFVSIVGYTKLLLCYALALQEGLVRLRFRVHNFLDIPLRRVYILYR